MPQGIAQALTPIEIADIVVREVEAYDAASKLWDLDLTGHMRALARWATSALRKPESTPMDYIFGTELLQRFQKLETI